MKINPLSLINNSRHDSKRTKRGKFHSSPTIKRVDRTGHFVRLMLSFLSNVNFRSESMRQANDLAERERIRKGRPVQMVHVRSYGHHTPMTYIGFCAGKTHNRGASVGGNLNAKDASHRKAS